MIDLPEASTHFLVSALRRKWDSDKASVFLVKWSGALLIWLSIALVSPPARQRRAAQHGECRPQHEWLTVLYNHCSHTAPGRQTCCLWPGAEGNGGGENAGGDGNKGRKPHEGDHVKTRKHLLLLKCIMALHHLLSCLELESDRDLNWSWRTAISEILFYRHLVTLIKI